MSKKRNKIFPVKSSHSADQSLTIYNQGFGIVQETRELRLVAGSNEVQLEGIPLQYVPNSMKTIHSATDENVVVTGVSHQPASMNVAQVLARLDGQEVELKHRSNSGRERWTSGTLVGFLNDKVLLSKGNSRNALINVSDIAEIGFSASVTEDLTKSSCLALSVDSERPGVFKVRVLYHTRGLSWQATHSATYDEKNGKLTDFESWASVDNRSGTAFASSRLTLLAGDVTPPQQDYGFEAAAAPMMSAAGGAKRARNAQSESVGEQKAFQVDGDFVIADGQNKLIPLVSARDVPVTREYFVPPMPTYSRGHTTEDTKPAMIRLRLKNDSESHLGVPLPAGEVKIYQADSRGDIQLTGTANIEHSAAGETVGFVIGTSTDIKAERKLVSRTDGTEGGGNNNPKPLGGPDVGMPGRGAQDRARRAAVAHHEEPTASRFVDEVWEVTVHNFKTDSEVQVTVLEDLPGRHEFLENSHKFNSERANRYSASLNIPANNKATLRFAVRIWAD